MTTQEPVPTPDHLDTETSQPDQTPPPQDADTEQQQEASNTEEAPTAAQSGAEAEAQETASEEAAAEAPGTEEPAAEAEEPAAAEEPASEAPTEEPAAEAEPPAAEEPAAEAEQPAAETEPPAAEEPASEAPAAEAEQPAAESAAEVEPVSEAPAEEPDTEATEATEAPESQDEAPAEAAETAEAQAEDEGQAEQAPAAEAEEAPAAEAEEQTGGKRRKKKGKGGGEAATPEQPAEQQQRKRKGPEPSEVIARIGTTNERALAYLADPDPKLSRLSRKVIEALLPELPPVTAGALLGPAGFTRHLVASAAAGRYRDLFVLWETFRRYPAEAKPELAERGAALNRGREKLKTAVRIGLTGRAERLAEDIAKAEGLIWQWLREALTELLPAVGARPAVAAALLAREPGLQIPLPAEPDDRWLAEAAAARRNAPLPEPLEGLLRDNVHRLPATVDTLRLATLHFPDRVEALVDRVDLDAPDIGAFLAWARDHGAAERLHGRIRERVNGAAARDRAEGLAQWYAWQQRGVQLELPESLRVDSLDGFDLSRPETAELASRLAQRGIELDLQAKLEDLAGQNRQLAEKAYEAMVCANLDVHLPEALESNPVVNPGTRCPKCRAWTWVRPGHEQRCPRPEPAEQEPVLDAFELAAAEAGVSDPQA